MEFYRRNWCFIGGILFVILSYFMAFWGTIYCNHIQVILVYSFMAMLVHQFEEYGIPGGFPCFMNAVAFGEKEVPDRYPLNANTAMINNVFMTYTFYITAILLPGAIWLGFMQVGQGMVQIINHGFYNNIKSKSLYNPGMASVLLLHWPLGIYYIWYVSTNGLAATSDYIIGLLGSFALIIILWLGPVALLKSKTSHYPFDKKIMFGYDEERTKATMAKRYI
jgi:hypothetical protein